MTPEQYNALSWDERYKVLHAVGNRADDLAGTEWLPTPGQFAHCDWDGIPTPYQQALREYDNVS